MDFIWTINHSAIWRHLLQIGCPRYCKFLLRLKILASLHNLKLPRFDRPQDHLAGKALHLTQDCTRIAFHRHMTIEREYKKPYRLRKANLTNGEQDDLTFMSQRHYINKYNKGIIR